MSSERPHVDGAPLAGSVVAPGSIVRFHALAGVLLADIRGCDAGNLLVWPGSHERIAARLRSLGWAALLDGTPLIDLGEPRQVTGRAGDAVVLHELTAHSIAPNQSSHIRYMAYTRLRRADLDPVDREGLTNPWRDWDGVRAIVDQH